MDFYFVFLMLFATSTRGFQMLEVAAQYSGSPGVMDMKSYLFGLRYGGAIMCVILPDSSVIGGAVSNYTHS